LGARLFQPEIFPHFRDCQFIEGNDPRTWTICRAPVWARSHAYCQHHHRLCYTARASLHAEAA
jgi:hypothetical protein